MKVFQLSWELVSYIGHLELQKYMLSTGHLKIPNSALPTLSNSAHPKHQALTLIICSACLLPPDDPPAAVFFLEGLGVSSPLSAGGFPRRGFLAKLSALLLLLVLTAADTLLTSSSSDEAAAAAFLFLPGLAIGSSSCGWDVASGLSSFPLLSAGRENKSERWRMLL